MHVGWPESWLAPRSPQGHFSRPAVGEKAQFSTILRADLTCAERSGSPAFPLGTAACRNRDRGLTYPTCVLWIRSTAWDFDKLMWVLMKFNIQMTLLCSSNNRQSCLQMQKTLYLLALVGGFFTKSTTWKAHVVYLLIHKLPCLILSTMLKGSFSCLCFINEDTNCLENK